MTSLEGQGERLAKLETSMAYVLDILSRREAYQNSVLESLTKINMKQDLFLEYQKECEAKREAHDVRIKHLEDGRKLDIQLRRILWVEAGLIGAFVSFVMTVVLPWLRK